MTTQLAKLQTELAQVEAAITAAYGGAEYKIEGGNSSRSLKRQGLDILTKRKGELELSISRLTGDGRGVRYGIAG